MADSISCIVNSCCAVAKEVTSSKPVSILKCFIIIAFYVLNVLFPALQFFHAFSIHIPSPLKISTGSPTGYVLLKLVRLQPLVIQSASSHHYLLHDSIRSELVQKGIQ